MVSFTLKGQWTKQADRWFEQGAYYKALEEYRTLLAENQQAAESGALLHRMGVCCLRMGDYTGAKEWLEKAKNQTDVEDDLYNVLGELYLLLGDYRNAKEAFLTYQKYAPNDERLPNRIASCDFGLKAPATNPNISIKPLPYINTRGSEYGILFVHGGLLYSSTGDLLPEKQKNLSLRTGMGYSKPYLSILKDNEYQPGMLLKGISKNNSNEGSFAYDAGAEQLYCTRCEADAAYCDIIKAQLKDYQFKETGVLKIGKGNYNIAHPFVEDNGSRIYFSSTMEGGYGGSDIWYLDRDPEGRWGAPVNMGESINTAGNEVFPYMWGGDFFFASDGHVGYGGLDIYVSHEKEGAWSNVRNLGAGINTSYDDFNIIIHKDGQGGLLVSNRTPGRSDDIFRFEIEAYTIEFHGTIKDKNTGEALPEAVAEFFSDGKTETIPVDQKGTFKVMLTHGVRSRMTISVPGYHSQTGEIRTENRTINPFGDLSRFEKYYYMEPSEIEHSEQRSQQEEVIVDQKLNQPDKEKETVTLKDLLSGANASYSMEINRGELKDKGWWVQVAMLKESKMVSYEFASKVTALTGQKINVYRGNDGGHRFYVGAYQTEQEARRIANLLKEAGVDCFIKPPME